MKDKLKWHHKCFCFSHYWLFRGLFFRIETEALLGSQMKATVRRSPVAIIETKPKQDAPASAREHVQWKSSACCHLSSLGCGRFLKQRCWSGALLRLRVVCYGLISFSPDPKFAFKRGETSFVSFLSHRGIGLYHFLATACQIKKNNWNLDVDPMHSAERMNENCGSLRSTRSYSSRLYRSSREFRRMRKHLSLCAAGWLAHSGEGRYGEIID